MAESGYEMEVYDVLVFETRAKQELQKFLVQEEGSILRVQRTLSLGVFVFTPLE